MQKVEEVFMKVHTINIRYLGLFFVVLTVGILTGAGFGVKEVAADDKAPPVIASDTRTCEHLWERLDLPTCMEVDAYSDLWSPASNGWLCEYSVMLKNNCSVAYEVGFDCGDVVSCPEGLVLNSGHSTLVKFGADRYGKGELGDKEVVMYFTSVDEGGEGSSDIYEEMTAGVFTGSASGEVVYEKNVNYDQDPGGCQVVPMGRSVGGFAGFAVMALGVFVWRRRVVG